MKALAAQCELCLAKDMLLEDVNAYVRYDSNSLSKGHVIVVPKRHVANYFEMTDAEKRSVMALLDKAKETIDRDFSPDGYNIGANIGEAAGQSRMHVHVHLIPRYRGDVADPKGGIRCVLARK
jgi:diadenosine tetraphosphate (Ap4A) HIT family hydrolase